MHSETLRCGLLGRTLSHSYSPAIHAQLAGYSYLLYEKEPEELEGFLRSGEFDGLNVTIPYKKTVIPYCAELSDTARAIGAVNTIVRRPDGTLWGGNTDAYGFSMLVQSSGAEVRGKKALVFGSGGASATAQYVLRQMGAREVVVISRHGEDNYENLGRHTDAEIAVNATPLGMYPNTGVSPSALIRFPALEAALLEASAHPLMAPDTGRMARTTHEHARCTVRYRFFRDGHLRFDLTSPTASFEEAGVG